MILCLDEAMLKRNFLIFKFRLEHTNVTRDQF